MSNYLLVLCSDAYVSALDEFFFRTIKVPSEDILTSRLDGATLYLVAHHGASSKMGHRNCIFRGYAIDHEAKTMLLSSASVNLEENYVRDHLILNGKEGCYIAAKWSNRRLLVGTDLFSTCPMVYSEHPGLFAVSDSVSVLADLRRQLGLPVSLNHSAAAARSWKNAMATQLLSPATIVSQIKFVRPGSALQVDSYPVFRTKELSKSVRDIFREPAGNYVENLREAAARMASILIAAGSLQKHSVVSLSGGLDSRVCLAAALLHSETKNNLSFHTSVRAQRDFEVTTALAQSAGIRLNPPDPVVSNTSPSARPLAKWYGANAGLYDLVLRPSRVSATTRAFVIGGHGAEVQKGNYGWRNVLAIARHVTPKDIGPSFLSEVDRGLSALGIDPRDPEGSEWHYLGYRNAIHSGRTVCSTLLGMRPFLERGLTSLSRSSLNPFPAPKKYQPSIVTDLLIVLQPELARLQFDEDRKNLATSFVDERLEILGGPISPRSVTPYTVKGDLNDVPNGPCRSLEKLSPQLDKCSYKELCISGFESIPHEKTRHFYLDTLKHALSFEQDSAPTTLPASVGKLVSYHMFN